MSLHLVPLRIPFKETRREIPVIHPFRERSMRSAAKEKDKTRSLEASDGQVTLFQLCSQEQ